jgi:hypothetical protein
MSSRSILPAMRKIIVPFALYLTAASASAGEITSAYTKYNLETCKRLSESAEESFGSFSCEGYAGHEIYFAEGDLRGFMAYGANGFEHCSAQQTFGHFNSITPTVEWRLDNGEPFAAIQRWHVSDLDDASKTTSWLGVTKIEAANSCRVAIIKGSLPRANEKAREAADTLAKGFNCQTDTALVISDEQTEASQLMSGTPCGPE